MSEKIVELDTSWVQRAFLVSSKELDTLDHRNSMWSDVVLKHTNTTLGGNYAINPPAQFTRFADIPSAIGNNARPSLSRYYSEAIDDNSQIVHFRMGEARYNTLIDFYTGAYRPEMANAARSGKMRQIFFEVGRVFGFVVSISSFKLLMIRALGEGLRMMTGMPKSRYYYHFPTMHTYWGAVTTIVNQLTVNRGIIPRIGDDAAESIMQDPSRFSPYEIQKLHEAIPDVFKENGGIDVYAVANKGKRLYREREALLKSLSESADISDFNFGEFLHDYNERTRGRGSQRNVSFEKYLEKWYNTDQSVPNGTESLAEVVTTDINMAESQYSGFDKLLEFFKTEMDDGGAFATFRVNSTGPVSESFSNSAGESDIQAKLNSMVSSSRNIDFSLAGGNVTGVIGEALSSVKGFIEGTLSGLGMQALSALGGSAFFDIPKVWQSSTANLPRANYSLKLTSPYGNPISQLFNIYVPLAMLLAMALPKSTGKQSYTSPFLIEYYDRGRAQSRLGMIDSMTFTRGTSSLGFNAEGHALSIDVNFSIMDLTSIMHMPITMGINPATELFRAVTGGIAGGAAGAVLGPAGIVGGASIGATLSSSLSTGLTDDDNLYSDYLAVLAGMGINDQIYWSRRLKLGLTRKLENWRSWASISNMASFAGDLPFPGRLGSIFFKGIEF